jgi:hypothetical protein
MLLEAYAQITFVYIFAQCLFGISLIFWTGVSFRRHFQRICITGVLFLLGSFGYVKQEDVVSL